VLVIGSEKEGRAIVIDGIPIDNAGPHEAGFKLLKAEDIKAEKNEKIKLVDSIPTDNSDSDKAGFRLPGGNKNIPEQRVIEVLIAEEDDDFAPGFKIGSETVDDVIIIAVGESEEVQTCFIAKTIIFK
jgi:hypothetical protein